MTKTEIMSAPNNKLIIELANTFAKYRTGNNSGVENINQHLYTVIVEMLQRGLIEEDDVKTLLS